jgi:4-amino-4-deoxy-L-arabinose transferase-like glycosyltransferase
LSGSDARFVSEKGIMKKEDSITRKYLEYALVAVVMLIALGLLVTSAWRKNSTFDEGAHIPAAYTYAAFGDFRMNPEHPPLMKLLAGIPLRFLKPRMDLEDADWKNAKQWEFGLKFLYEWNDADRVIFWARVPVMLLTLLLGFFVWRCARELYGWQSGFLALLLCLFNPDVLAHGRLVTTDLSIALFIFLSVYAYYRALHRLTIWSGLGAGLVVGLSLLAKYSAILVFPMLALVGLAYAFANTTSEVSPPKPGSEPRFLKTRLGKLKVAGGLLAAVMIVALVVLWAGYRFRYQIATTPEVSATIDWDHYWQKETLMTSLMQMPHSLKLLPEGYSYGFLFALESLERRFAYLAGDYSTTGWWFYFIVTFLIKTPISLLALIGLGFYFLRRYGAGVAAECMLLLPVALYWLVALTSSMNIGHRHLLPIYPFLFVFASKVARVFAPPRPRRLAIVCGLLVGWYLASTAFIYPHFLAYFNEAVGGPSQGYRWLADSNLDWGQDLKLLAKYRREHPEEPFYLSYFGTAYADYYGIRANILPGFNSRMAERLRNKDYVRFEDVPSGAIVAISATNLSGVYMRNYRIPGTERFLQRLRDMRPIAHIGYSIFIYRMP